MMWGIPGPRAPTRQNRVWSFSFKTLRTHLTYELGKEDNSWATGINRGMWEEKKGLVKQNSHFQMNMCSSVLQPADHTCTRDVHDRVVTGKKSRLQWGLKIQSSKDVRKQNRLWRKPRERERKGDWNVKIRIKQIVKNMSTGIAQRHCRFGFRPPQ